MTHIANGPVARAAGRTSEGIKISFEFFPPKTPEMEDSLWRAVKSLEPFSPRFVSVTYGAGGSTRERTHRTVKRIVEETSLATAAHLTCVGASREEVDAVARHYAEAGVKHIVALRGDAPGGPGEVYQPHPSGYANAAELVTGLRELGDFEISVAAHPEQHPDSPDLQADIDNLKRKLDAGANRAITQFFFEVETFLRFVERARAAGITAPITPGIMLQPNFVGLSRMATLCGTQIPAWYADLFDGLDQEPETRRLVAAAVAAEFCAKLQEEGFDEFHFYTLNRADLASAICRVLGLKPRADIAAEK